MVKAPELVDHVEASAAVIVMGDPAIVAPISPSWVILNPLSAPMLNTAESDVRLRSSPTVRSPPSATTEAAALAPLVMVT